jgi:hypothetical protein
MNLSNPNILNENDFILLYKLDLTNHKIYIMVRGLHIHMIIYVLMLFILYDI